jgi:hypothetical protein
MVKNLTVYEKKLLQNPKGSFFVVLPLWWIEQNSLKKADKILMNVENINRITITIPEIIQADDGMARKDMGEESGKIQR